MSAHDELLEELVFQVLERGEHGSVDALEELCAEHPELASSLRARVASLRDAGFVGGDELAPEHLGEFRIVRRLGQGGMGVVWLAYQPRLARHVAVKMVRPEQLYFRGARERFQREVEAIARLSHPAIVQIFTVGDEEGAPYYAMELAPGASLAEVLKRLRGRNASQLSGADLRTAVVEIAREHGFRAEAVDDGPLFSGAWADACAWLIREVAQALEHAHQRGVLHRDVKPSNILITPQGRVLLTDFGLASTQGDERITGHGAQIGSPAYMPPEQSGGEASAVGPRSDVYSLGVTLYEALALELPWEPGSSSTGAERRPIPLARRRPGVPSDFELACSTAFDPQIERRYASAAHFARDLTNLLQRRPIEARPIGPVLALRRWSQRHPAAATALALSLLAILTVPTIYAAQESRARARIAVERDVARGNLDAALDAIELLLERVAHRDLRDVPGVDGLRTELLERATELYAKLEATAASDLRTQRRSAVALGRLARLRSETGDRDGALRDFDEAQRRMQAVVDTHPNDAAARFELGNLLAFATIRRFPDSTPQALAKMQNAVHELRRALELDPSSKPAQHEYVRGLLGLAYFHAGLEQSAEAEARWTEALELSGPLADDGFDPRDGVELGITALGQLGGLAQARGEFELAERRYREMVQRCESSASSTAFLRQMHAIALQTLARMHAEAQGADPDPKVEDWAQRSHAIFEALVRDFPRNDSYVSSLALSWMDLGDRAREFGDLELAQERWGTSRQMHERWRELSPTNPRAVRSLGLLTNRESDYARTRRDYPRAAERLIETLELFAEANRLADRAFCRDHELHALRAQVHVAQELDDDELAADAARGISQRSGGAFDLECDAGVGFRVAAGIALGRGDGELEGRWLTEMRAAFERALAAPNPRPSWIAEQLEAWALTDDPRFADLYAKLREP